MSPSHVPPPFQVIGTHCGILPRYTLIVEEDFKEDIFLPFYDDNSIAEQDPLEAHELALLLFVFAMGKLTDPQAGGYEVLPYRKSGVDIATIFGMAFNHAPAGVAGDVSFYVLGQH